jgi:dihydroorotate dehydrogenase
MNFRFLFDKFYEVFKTPVYTFTQRDPEYAHEMFISLLKILEISRLDNIILRIPEQHTVLPVSNAAGLFKEAKIHPSTLNLLGFDRIVYGTVTGKAWMGNQRPRCMRFVSTNSLVNWMGLPGSGADVISDRIRSFSEHSIPLTINVMATPQTEPKDWPDDVSYSINKLKGLPNIDRFELNISCPNTKSKDNKLDHRTEFLNQLEPLIKACKSRIKNQQLWLKISPDLELTQLEDIVKISKTYEIQGITACNTTTNHLSEFVPDSPGKGGASGNAVKDRSKEVLKILSKLKSDIYPKLDLISCGGVDSKQEQVERKLIGASEVQLYTPLIFNGPALLSELNSK